MTPETPAPPARRWLKILAAIAIIIVLFYAEEDWRGRAAWKACKSELEQKGAKLNWSDYIPAPVPESQNIFAVPEMQKWFVGKGSNEFTDMLHYPDPQNSGRLVVAHLIISLPGASPPAEGQGVELQSEDDHVKEQARVLIRQAVGPVVVDQGGAFYMRQLPSAIHPPQIYLLFQTSPNTSAVEQLIPSPLIAADSGAYEDARVEPVGDGSYNVTIRTPGTVADFLKWNEQLAPQFAIISNALQRPAAVIPGDYQNPHDIPVPDTVAVRALSQRLGALARSHLALGQPAKALEELTFMDQLRRLLEAPPITLGAAMMDVGITERYVDVAADGMRLGIWNEPQLAALEAQLKEINLQSAVANSVQEETAGICQMSEKYSGKFFGATFSTRRAFLLTYIVPKGWVYQNMIGYANLEQNWLTGFGTTNQQVIPHQIDAAEQAVGDFNQSHRHSPFRYLALMANPNFPLAAKALVATQTKVNQAQIVCALERFHLAEHENPATLEPLTLLYIAKIPNDIIGGQPPHYRRNPDGSFVLYSIGWDEMNHQGLSGADLVWVGK